jgi:hypothetical protein
MRAGYKGRELLRSFFFSITHCFWRFIKGFCLRSDGKTESSAISLDGCGVASRSKCKTVEDHARFFSPWAPMHLLTELETQAVRIRFSDDEAWIMSQSRVQLFLQ